MLYVFYFTLINNILNNILNNNNKNGNTINANKYHGSDYLISFLIHYYYIFYIPYLCDKLKIIQLPHLRNDFFIDFIYDVINVDSGFEIKSNDIKFIYYFINYDIFRKIEELKIKYKCCELYVNPKSMKSLNASQRHKHSKAIQKFLSNFIEVIVNIDLKPFTDKIREIWSEYFNKDISLKPMELKLYKFLDNKNSFFEHLTITPKFIEGNIHEFFNKMTYIKKFKLYKIYNLSNKSISNSSILIKYCESSDFEKNYNKSDIINISYNTFSDELENIIRHLLNNKYYVIINIDYIYHDSNKFINYKKTGSDINILQFEKVITTEKYMHSIIFTDYYEESETYRFKNNWGPEWGYDGYGYTRLKDINILDISFLANDEMTYSLVKEFNGFKN